MLLTSIRSASEPNLAEGAHAEALEALRGQVPGSTAPPSTRSSRTPGSPTACGTRTARSPTSGRPASCDGRCSRPGGACSRGGGSPRDDVFELHLDEVAALLTGGRRPRPGGDRRRAATRRWEATLDPPARLAPRRHRRRWRCSRRTSPASPGSSSRSSARWRRSRTPRRLTGIGIGTEPYAGTARVVHDAAEALVAMEPGDVIVAPYTAPTYNAVLAMAGAIVTEQGGLLCHAAVIARELGLPAVIGAKDAMEIPMARPVEVDPSTGRVRVLSG